MPEPMTHELWNLDEAAYPRDKSLSEKLAFLLNYAQLAPSSHNSQPWQFSIQGSAIHLYPDLDHWLKVADPERRELYISLGCALENLLVAAEHFHLGYQVSFFSDRDDTAHFASVTFVEDSQIVNVRDPALFKAIQQRRTNRQPFQTRLIPKEELLQIKAARLEKDLHLHFIANIEQKRQLAAMVKTADKTLFANPAYRSELANTLGESAFGNNWPWSRLRQMIVRQFNLGTRTGKQNAQHLLSAPVLVVLSARSEDAIEQIKIGQLYERIALTATKLGLSIQPLSQILEIPSQRQELANLLPDNSLLPQHFFRLGYTTRNTANTPRRAVRQDSL
ncbi:MAG: Acg family FMN-binding oxidoreductase [Gammaproteobacteria bacterium]